MFDFKTHFFPTFSKSHIFYSFNQIFTIPSIFQYVQIWCSKIFKYFIHFVLLLFFPNDIVIFLCNQLYFFYFVGLVYHLTLSSKRLFKHTSSKTVKFMCIFLSININFTTSVIMLDIPLKNGNFYFF